MITEPLSKAIETVAEIIRLRKADPANILMRDAAIQRFEYTHELCVRFIYKALKNKLDKKYVESLSIMNVLKEAAKASLVSDPIIWEKFREARNKSSHAYSEKVASEVVAIMDDFYGHARFLLQALESGRYD